jgi:ornithine carbamoyltransferase
MKHFLSINDINKDEALFLLAEAARLKAQLRENPLEQQNYLRGKSLAMIFEKASLRTRVSFDIGFYQLGGHAIYLSPAEIGLGKRESIADVSKVLSRMADGVMARVFRNSDLREFAAHASVPVINGLCDMEHPCQAMADLLTIQEHKGLENRRVAYLGDGNNVCHSLMLLCTKLGLSFAAGVPEGYEPGSEFVERARRDGEVLITNDPGEAVKNADVVYTDVWTSMGQEEESAKRLQVFPPFQVSAALMSHAKPDAIVLHCLPAHRGEEIAAEVIDSPQSKVFGQAENRLHAQKAVMLWLMGNTK